MDKTKRERGVNFSISERDLLVSLIRKYQNILENKQSDATTWKKKEDVWKNIHKEYNARSGGTLRSVKTLKVKYEGLKRTVRKKSAVIRAELYRTGGGANKAPPLDPVEENIKAMITLSSDGLESIYDSDVIPQQSQDLSNPIIEEFKNSPYSSQKSDPKEEVIINSQTNQVHEVDLEETQFIIINSEPDAFHAMPSTSAETCTEENNIQQNNVNDMALHDSSSGKYVTTPTINKIWDVTSRRNLKSKKHPALIANLPKKTTIDDLTQAKMELVQLQKGILESEMIEKKKEWDYKELQRLEEKEFVDKERKWKEEEYKLKNLQMVQDLQFKEKEDKRKEEEHKLRLQKLRKELNE